ncbi:MAG: hypothetical protein K0R22_3308 [Sporomusa sp.]|nr:hypothetical protein [Sporomusa sp.]
MICMHDENLAAVMKKHDFQMSEEPADTERQFYRRFAYFYGLRSNPMGDYIKESIAMERENVAGIIGIVQNMI